MCLTFLHPAVMETQSFQETSSVVPRPAALAAPRDALEGCGISPGTRNLSPRSLVYYLEEKKELQ